MRVVKVLLIMLLFGVFITGAKAQDDPIAPHIFLRGVQFSQGVRYTASFIKPSDDSVLRNISVEITLPPSARLTEMLVSKQVDFDVVRVNQAGETTLIWQLLRVDANTPPDPFAFTLREPLTADIEFYIKWQSQDGTRLVENFFELPPLVNASQPEGQISPTLEGYAFVMRTGVQVSAPAPEVPYIMNVRVLSTDFNPPRQYGNIWWCSVLEILGLPQDTQVDVIVPLRSPVAPFTVLQLFQQQADDTNWLPLDSSAIVTADGQYVMYKHPGGIIATGGDEGIRLDVVTDGLPPVDDDDTTEAITPEDPTNQEDPTPTPTPESSNTGQTDVPLSDSVILNPSGQSAQRPEPFGAGGVRVEIFTLADGDFFQCQVGRVNCMTLKRRLGAGLR